jgi:hypothetical protein
LAGNGRLPFGLNRHIAIKTVPGLEHHSFGEGGFCRVLEGALKGGAQIAKKSFGAIVRRGIHRQALQGCGMVQLPSKSRARESKATRFFSL